MNAELKVIVAIEEHSHEVIDSPLAQARPLLKEDFYPAEGLLDSDVDGNFSVKFTVYRPRLWDSEYIFEVAHVSRLISIPGFVAWQNLVVAAMRK